MVQVLVGIVRGAGAQGMASVSHSAARPLPKAAAPVAVAPRKAGKAAPKPRGDWAPAPGKPGPAKTNPQPSRMVAANGHAVNPEQVIPMDDADLKEF